MTIEQALIKVLGFDSKVFIEKAIEGGWKKYEIASQKAKYPKYDWPKVFVMDDDLEGWIDISGVGQFRIEQILLDPTFWQAVGKVEKDRRRWRRDIHDKDGLPPIPAWHFYMNRFIDALCEGMSNEQYPKML